MLVFKSLRMDSDPSARGIQIFPRVRVNCERLTERYWKTKIDFKSRLINFETKNIFRESSVLCNLCIQ